MSNSDKSLKKVRGFINIKVYDENGNLINEINDENDSTLYFDFLAGRVNLILYPVLQDVRRVIDANALSNVKSLSDFGEIITSTLFSGNLSHNQNTKTYNAVVSWTNNTGNTISLYGVATTLQNNRKILATLYTFNNPIQVNNNNIIVISYIISYANIIQPTTQQNITYTLNNINDNLAIPINISFDERYFRLQRYNRVIVKNKIRYGFNQNDITNIQSQISVNIDSIHPKKKALKSLNQLFNQNILDEDLESNILGEFYYHITQSGGIGVAKARRFILVNSGGVYDYNTGYYYYYSKNYTFYQNDASIIPFKINKHISEIIENYKDVILLNEKPNKTIKVYLNKVEFNNYYSTVDWQIFRLWLQLSTYSSQTTYTLFQRINNQSNMIIMGSNYNKNIVYFAINTNGYSNPTINNARIVYCYNSGKIVGYENIPQNATIYTDLGEQISIVDAIGKTLNGRILYFNFDIDENNPPVIIFETQNNIYSNTIEEYKYANSDKYLQLYGFNGFIVDNVKKEIWSVVYGDDYRTYLPFLFRLNWKYDDTKGRFIGSLSNIFNYPVVRDINTNSSWLNSQFYKTNILLLVFVKDADTGEIKRTLMTLKDYENLGSSSSIIINGKTYLLEWEIPQVDEIENLVIDFTGSINFNAGEYITFQINDNDYLMNSTTLETYNFVIKQNSVLTRLLHEDEPNRVVYTTSHAPSYTKKFLPSYNKQSLEQYANVRYIDYYHEFYNNHLVLVYQTQFNNAYTNINVSSDWKYHAWNTVKFILPIPKVIKHNGVEYIVDLRDIKITDGYREVLWSVNHAKIGGRHIRDNNNNLNRYNTHFLPDLEKTSDFWYIEITDNFLYNYGFNHGKNIQEFYVFIKKKTLNDLLPLNLTILNHSTDAIINGIVKISLPFALPNTINIRDVANNQNLEFCMVDDSKFRNLKYSNIIYVKIPVIGGSTQQSQSRHTMSLSNFIRSGIFDLSIINNDNLVENQIIGYISSWRASNNTNNFIHSGSNSNVNVHTTFGSIQITIENTQTQNATNYRNFFDFIYEVGKDDASQKFIALSNSLDNLKFNINGINFHNSPSNIVLAQNTNFNQPYFTLITVGNHVNYGINLNNNNGNYVNVNKRNSKTTCIRNNLNVKLLSCLSSYNSYNVSLNIYPLYTYQNINYSSNAGFRFALNRQGDSSGYDYINKIIAYKHIPATVKELYENPYNYIISSHSDWLTFRHPDLAYATLIAIIDKQPNQHNKVFLYVKENWMPKSIGKYTNAFYIYDYVNNKGLFDIIPQQNVKVYTYFNNINEVVSNTGLSFDFIIEHNSYINPFVNVRKIRDFVSDNTDFACLVIGYPYEIIHTQAITNAYPIVNLEFLKNALGGRYYKFRNESNNADVNFTSIPANTDISNNTTQIDENSELLALHNPLFATKTSYRNTNNNLNYLYLQTPLPIFRIERDTGKIKKFSNVFIENYNYYNSNNGYYYIYDTFYQIQAYYNDNNNLNISSVENPYPYSKGGRYANTSYTIFNTNLVESNLNLPLPSPNLTTSIISGFNLVGSYTSFPYLKRIFIRKSLTPTQSTNIPSSGNGFRTEFYEIYWFSNTYIKNTPIFFTNNIPLDKIKEVRRIDPIFITNANGKVEITYLVFMKVMNTETNEVKIYSIDKTLNRIVDITTEYYNSISYQDINIVENMLGGLYNTLYDYDNNLIPFMKFLNENINANDRNKYQVAFGVAFRYLPTHSGEPYYQMKFYGINLDIDLLDKNLYRNVRYNYFNTNTMNIVSDINNANTIIIEPIPSNYFIIETDANSQPDTNLIVNTNDIDDRKKPFKVLNLLSGMNVREMLSVNYIEY